MSFGGGPLKEADWQARLDKQAAQAAAERAARLAGYKSPFRRLLERLRPHREDPGSYPQNFPGTPGNPED